MGAKVSIFRNCLPLTGKSRYKGDHGKPAARANEQARKCEPKATIASAASFKPPQAEKTFSEHDVQSASTPSRPLLGDAAELPPRPRWGFCRCARRARAAHSTQETSGGRAVDQPAEITPAFDEYGARSPTLESLSEKKRKLVQEMRARIDGLPRDKAPPRRHDLWLKRFLAHGKWKLDKAMQLYLEMEEWRKQIGADTILEKFPEGPPGDVLQMDLIGFYPYGVDKLGRSVAWMRVGQAPWWRALFEKIEENVLSQLWMGEWIDAQVSERARKNGEWRERSVIFVDLGELDYNYFQGLASSGRARRRGALQSVAQYYPGIVDKVFVLNAPGFANKAWSILKVFLSKELMEKAVMVANPAERAEMLEELGAANVPRALGGTSSSPTTQLPAHVQMPAEGWKRVIAAWRPEEIVINARSHFERLVPVPKGGRVRWQWALLDHSISWEVSRRRIGGDFETVLPEREESFTNLEDPVKGEACAPDGGGEVRLFWDNRSSQFRSKTLLLRLEVV